MSKYLIALHVVLFHGICFCSGTPTSATIASPSDSSLVSATPNPSGVVANNGATDQAVQNLQPLTPAIPTIIVGQSYTMLQLLTLGYAVEVKNFTAGESAPDAVAKSAVWKTNAGVQEFWQGIVNSAGQIVLTQKLSAAPANTTLISSTWSGNAEKTPANNSNVITENPAVDSANAGNAASSDSSVNAVKQ